MSAADKKNKQVGTESKTGGYISLLIITMLVGIANLGIGFFQGQQNQVRLTKAGDLRVLSQQVAKNAAEASKGNTEAFDLLSSSIIEFEAQYSHLAQGDDSKGLGRSPDAILNREVKQVGDLWQEMKRDAEEIFPPVER